MSHRLKRNTILALTGLALLTAVGVSYAAIPSAGGTINGCYGKLGGIMRVIDVNKNQKCSSALEVPLSWNQQGIKGDQGIQGIQGIQGVQGPKGDQGIQGQQGPAGPPAISRAEFTSSSGGVITGTSTLILQKAVPPGSWVFLATVSAIGFTTPSPSASVTCTLEDSAGGELGRATADVKESEGMTWTLSLNGGTFVAAGFQIVSLQCSISALSISGGSFGSAQMLTMQVGGFGIS